MRAARSPFGFTRTAAVVALAAMLTIAACAGGGDPSATGAAGNKTAPAAGRPNIVVIMTDDQTVESLRVMPKLRTLIAKQGTTFEQNVVSYSLCCPSRATYLTGQYATNHRVLGNVPPWGGYGVFKQQDTTFPVALQSSGYETIHIGKYLNGYGLGPQVVAPPGWSQWNGAIDPSTYKYFGFTLLQNDRLKTYAKRDHQYQTDVYTNLAVSAIRRQADRGKPFFMNIAYLAPHVEAVEKASSDNRGRAVAAPRHAGTLADEPVPRSPAFDEADVSNKPRWVQALPRLSPKVRAEMKAGYDVYLESLLAVDDGVGRIIDALGATGQLDNTVVIFTSDNGFFFGEHRIAAGKDRFYEPSIRVPLLMRGPGVPRRVTQRSLVANIDLAPTILGLAHATALREMDGRSMVPLLEGRRGPEDRGVLLQSGGPYRPDFGVRTPRYVYVEYDTGERELYDLRRDPGQLHNLAGVPALAAVQATLAQRLAVLKTCAGATCN